MREIFYVSVWTDYEIKTFPVTARTEDEAMRLALASLMPRHW